MNEPTTTSSNPPEAQPMSINFSEADHLFLEDLATVKNILTNDAEVTSLIYVIGQIGAQIDRYKQSKSDHIEFYDRRIESAEDQIDFLKTRIESYLKTKGETKLATPNGTVFFTNREKAVYPSDEVLIEWSKQHNIPVKVVESPIKAEILQKIKQGEDAPDGFQFVSVESLSLRANSGG